MVEKILNKSYRPTTNILLQSPDRTSSSPFTPHNKYRYDSSYSSRHSSRSSSPIRAVSSRSDSLLKISKQRQNSDAMTSGSRSETYTGSISVAIRPRPIPINEREAWFVKDDVTLINKDNDELQFDTVFNPSSSNLQVFEKCCEPLLEKLIAGYNATIFAYGMTGSGKTFTMSGDDNSLGLVSLSVSYLFDRIKNEAANSVKTHEVVVSYLEIYNEKLYDLLDLEACKTEFGTPGRFSSTSSASTSSGASVLKIREISAQEIKIVGLTEHVCSSSEKLMEWIRLGDSNRKTGETEYNARSSRSHAVVLIRLTTTDLIETTSTTSTLSLCDLAGSEKAMIKQERRKEGAFINKSLLALGTVISKLSLELSRDDINLSHIPYRDSNLTRILQPALSGNSVVTTICTIDTRRHAVAETVNTLRFASRAKNVSINAKKQVLSNSKTDKEKDALISNLIRQVEDQKRLISTLENRQPAVSSYELLTSSLGPSSNYNPNVASIQSENNILKYQLEHCKALLEKDTIELQGSDLVQLIAMLPEDVGNILETKIQGLQSQIREYESYTNSLEKRLITPILTSQRVASNSSDVSMTESYFNNNELELVIADKETEIQDLKARLSRKDKVIDALQSVKRLRDRVLQPLEDNESSPNHIQNQKYPTLS